MAFQASAPPAGGLKQGDSHNLHPSCDFCHWGNHSWFILPVFFQVMKMPIWRVAAPTMQIRIPASARAFFLDWVPPDHPPTHPDPSLPIGSCQGVSTIGNLCFILGATHAPGNKQSPSSAVEAALNPLGWQSWSPLARGVSWNPWAGGACFLTILESSA